MTSFGSPCDVLQTTSQELLSAKRKNAILTTRKVSTSHHMQRHELSVNFNHSEMPYLDPL